MLANALGMFILASDELDSVAAALDRTRSGRMSLLSGLTGTGPPLSINGDLTRPHA